MELAIKAFGLPESTVTHVERGLRVMRDRTARGRKPIRKADYGKVARGVAKLVKRTHWALKLPGIGQVNRLGERYGMRPWEIVRNVLDDRGELLEGFKVAFYDLPPGAAPLAAALSTGDIARTIEEAFPTDYPVLFAMMCAVLEDAAGTMLERFSKDEIERYGKLCRKYPGRHGSSFLIGVALWGWLEEKTGERIEVEGTTIDDIEKLARDPVEKAVNENLDVV